MYGIVSRYLASPFIPDPSQVVSSFIYNSKAVKRLDVRKDKTL